MSEHLKTCNIFAIRSYYNKDKAKLLRLSKQYATNDNGSNILADVGIEDSDGAHHGQNIKNDSVIDIENVLVHLCRRKTNYNWYHYLGNGSW